MNLTVFKKYRIGIGIVFFTWLIFFSPIISGQYTYFLDDLKIIYYPIEALYADFQHSWQLPLWANEFGFGQPLLAWGQLGFFTPLHLLMRALFIPPLTLLQISVAAYFLIGSMGMFAFLVRRNFHQAAAVLGAVVFAYCGFSIGHLNHVNFYTSTMLLPLLLLALDAIIQKSSLVRATTLALVASAIAVSGQPQVIAYVFAIGFIVGLAMYIKRPSVKALLLTVYAVVVACMLSSYALLPLQEFLPQTERSAGLPGEELFEFSYPPYATITLLFPYFFGDHANYTGPKGFQELAAYVGIIPLLLTGMALSSWRTFKGERVAGIILVCIGIILALGRYSFLYTYLVEHHFITSIGVVGRFVFFFDIGVVLLSTIGLHDLITTKNISWRQKVVSLFTAYAFPALLIVVPFWIYASTNSEAKEHFFTLFNSHVISWWLIIGGLLAPFIIVFTKQNSKPYVQIKTWALPCLAALTLVQYGWDYNPRVTAKQAYTPSPFHQDLEQYKQETHLPARLYAAERLPVTGNPGAEKKLSDFISPLFTVFQPLHITQPHLRCLLIPIQADSTNKTEMTVMIRSGFSGTIWHQQTISSEDVFKDTTQRICFSEIPENEQKNLIVSFASDTTTNMKLFTSPSESDAQNSYFVRVQHPTPQQLERSKKQLSVEYAPEFPRLADTESALMVRHIQALAGASSARWIGALSLRPYREFVDSFFANDSEAFDGDGVHALTRNKTLVDMSGVTHFTQLLEYGQTNDPMIKAGYELVREADTGESLIRLYKNPHAYPKAFIVPRGQFIAADDEIRTMLRDPNYNPKEVVYISGPTPPLTKDTAPTELQASATILSYTQTRVDIETNSNIDAFVVLTDSTSNQWQTYIDDAPALQLKANTMFKAAQIPAGKHIVSFRYYSPATHISTWATIIGGIMVLLGYASYYILPKTKKA